MILVCDQVVNNVHRRLAKNIGNRVRRAITRQGYDTRLGCPQVVIDEYEIAVLDW
jgi:hypothetical protein